MKRIIRENTISTKQHYVFEGTDEQRTDEAWEVTCGYLDAKQKAKLEWSRDEDGMTAENAAFIACMLLGISGYFPLQAMTEFFEGKREFS
jgi:uncharacterized protein (DUF1684 family)